MWAKWDVTPSHPRQGSGNHVVGPARRERAKVRDSLKSRRANKNTEVHYDICYTIAYIGQYLNLAVSPS